MPVESSGHSKDNPRMFELIEHVPETGKSPTVWAWPQLVDYLKVAGQPVSGPWPPHQEPRPDPDYESGPVAIPDPQAAARPRPRQEPGTREEPGAREEPGTRGEPGPREEPGGATAAAR
jgi:hypothetical protein